MCDFSGFKYVFKCAHCGEDFGANRRDKRFCSTSHATRHSQLINPNYSKERSARRKEKINSDPNFRIREIAQKRSWEERNPEKHAANVKSNSVRNKEYIRRKSREIAQRNLEAYRKLNILESQGVYEAMALYELVKSGTVTITQNGESK